MNQQICLLDLFSGIGGFALGLKMAGFKLTHHLYSEVDPHADAVYRYHYPEATALGSVMEVKSNINATPDIITFGSPCQDFSYEGSRKGIEGKRSKLLRCAIELVDALRPGVFVWENVKGAFSSNEGRDFQAILQAFTNLGGYRLEWQLCNTRWVLPQNRERIYLIGHLDGKSRPCVFPFQQSDQISDTAGNKERKNRQWKQGESVISTITRSYAKMPNAGETYLYVNSGLVQGYEVAYEGNIIDLSFPTSNSRKGRVQTEVAKTIQTGGHQGVLAPAGLRRLTEIECERFQGFPDDWTKWGMYENELMQVPRYQRYQLVGNAVTVDIVKAVGQRLIRSK